MMFESDTADYVAEQQQKLVVVVMVGGEQLIGFDGQVFVNLELLRSHVQVFRLVCKDIQVHGIGARWREVNAAVIKPRIHG